ncbi:bolA-like family protein [Tasmannia lanceolata]|uniref:bolA-like family protein n=1 Tax=Tasmannia lanceolata TaxID=3420 RepID=UPI00406471B0
MATTLLIRPYVLCSALRNPLVRCSLATPLVCRRRGVFQASSAPKLEIHGVSCSTSQFHALSGRRFSIRATQVSNSGSIDSPMMQSMENKIKEQLNADEVTVTDAYGDGRHVSIDVISSAFEGQSAVNRQRLVYKAIWEELQSTVHAVDQMTTRTPAEAAEK